MYEMLCLISSKTEEKEISSITKKIEEIIKDLKGEVSYIKNLGEKKLAYPIKHERKGYYLILYFELPCQEIKNFEEKLKNIFEILRYQITKQEHIPRETKEKKPIEKAPAHLGIQKKTEKISAEEINKILEKY